jgi:hypothetical protein
MLARKSAKARGDRQRVVRVEEGEEATKVEADGGSAGSKRKRYSDAIGGQDSKRSRKGSA